MVAAFKPLRPRSLRYGVEQQHLEDWLATVQRVAATHYDLAVEVAAARNLVKGYGDTHERGRARFETLMGLLPTLSQRPDGAAQLARSAQGRECGRYRRGAECRDSRR